MVIRIDIRLEKCVSRFCSYVTQVVLLNFNRKSEILSALRTSTPCYQWRAEGRTECYHVAITVCQE
jgi:hypothetical protein